MVLSFEQWLFRLIRRYGLVVTDHGSFEVENVEFLTSPDALEAVLSWFYLSYAVTGTQVVNLVFALGNLRDNYFTNCHVRDLLARNFEPYDEALLELVVSAGQATYCRIFCEDWRLRSVVINETFILFRHNAAHGRALRKFKLILLSECKRALVLLCLSHHLDLVAKRCIMWVSLSYQVQQIVLLINVIV